ncbi:MAG TPA: phosphate ABC transporter, permease protein PstA, partial [Stellaceae bacterium]|nr:phosphate ABC transporter, permease protein PstA [Stellaceae bacterium]
MDSLLYGRRRATNFIVLSLSFAATAAGLLVLFLILWSLLRNGVPALGADIFTQNTPPPGSRGGLLNAIYGSLLMTGVATVVGTPVGILCGTFLAEFSRSSRLAMAVRFINDILLSAPSIVIGLFVYVVMVVP